jgi:glutamate-1-semialdehyde 2,1-aminomutase
MALGAVALGYGHPVVTKAVERAVRDGCVGSLAPTLEYEVAARLCEVVPGAEAVRFLKTGAEAVAAAVRIARVHTGRDRIVTSGYQGWLDTVSDAAGVPVTVAAQRTAIPFNDVAALESALGQGDPVAAVVVEPVVDGPPTAEWVQALNAVSSAGIVLALDEIKTGIRLGPGGAAARYGLRPHLTILGKALANGFPLAAVCGQRDIMQAAERTWISSTLATEFVSLAAANAVLDLCDEQAVGQQLGVLGGTFYMGLEEIAAFAPHINRGVRGIPEFCYIDFVDDATSARVAQRCAQYGLLLKRTAYNFVSLAHTPEIIQEALLCLRGVVEEVAYG